MEKSGNGFGKYEAEKRKSGADERKSGAEMRKSSVETRKSGVEKRKSGADERKSGAEKRKSGVNTRKGRAEIGKSRRLKETGAGAITMAKRKRDMQLNFRVSAEELAVIEQKMSQFGTSNREAYLRKMALDGYVVKLELPELKELVSLMRRSSNNLNQLTRKVHETGRVYDADLEDISQRQEQLWEGVKEILTQLSKLL